MRKTLLLNLLMLLSAINFVATGSNYSYISLKRESWPKSVQLGKPFEMVFSIDNNDTEDISTLTIQYSPYGGSAMTVTKTLDTPIAPGEKVNVAVDGFVCYVAGRSVGGTFTLSQVNGHPNSGSDAYCYLFCAERLIQKRFVLEEVSSITCGWCPRAIVTLERLAELDTELQWIPININKGYPLLASADFATVISNVPTIPNCVIDRDYSNIISPHPLLFEDIYAQRVDICSAVDIEASATISNDGAITISGRFQKIFPDEDAPLSISVVLSEDNLGPYQQRNYYSGGSEGNMYGWETYDSYHTHVYNHVGRPGSLYEPQTISDDLSFNLTLSSAGITNIANAHAVVMAIDSPTGMVEQAVKLPIQKDMTAIYTVTSDINDGPVEYFDLSGRRVESPSKGIYISRGQKIIIK